MKKIMIILSVFILLDVSLFAFGLDVEYKDFKLLENEKERGVLSIEIDQSISISENFGVGFVINFNPIFLSSSEITLDKNFQFTGSISYKDILFYFKKDIKEYSKIIGLQKKYSQYKKMGIEFLLPYNHYYYEDNSVYLKENKSIILIIEDQFLKNDQNFSFFIQEKLKFSEINSYIKNQNYNEFINTEISISIQNKIGVQSGYFNCGVLNTINITNSSKTKLDFNNLEIFIGFRF
ncbi:hypothetical protein K9L04_00665 [Patescibacteria group bacterium]|nr:hypothetical protein [Patescibacteria group bacterium]